MNHLPIPHDVLKSHCAVLGKTNAGKSSLLRAVVEDLLDRGKRVCVIDPKGDWYGIKLGADGKSSGYPVIAFGDFVESAASDVPINEHSGRHVAELISSGNRPCVIGFRGWMPGRTTRFWIDFASTLFNSKSGELYLLIDEVQNFAPKGKVWDPESGKSLHWTNRLMSEGRGLGFVILVASQRPQKVHNDTLTCCETLFAMRVVHAADRKAVEEWIDGCGDPQHGKEVLSSVASLGQGEAFVWCPEAKYGPKRVQFPMFRTFDSFAPPQLQKKISAAGWAGVDLDAVRKKLESVIAEAKANDPSELKRQLAAANQEIKKWQRASHEKIPAFQKTREIKVLKNGQLRRAEQLIERLGDRLEQAREVSVEVSAQVEDIAEAIKSTAQSNATPKPLMRNTHVPRPPAPRRQPPVATETLYDGDADKPLSRCEHAILNVLAQQANRIPKQIALTSGYSVRSSTFQNGLSSLRVKQFITRGQPINATPDGLAKLGPVEPLPTGKALEDIWLEKLDKCSGVILVLVIGAGKNGITREQIAEDSGYSLTSSTFQNGLSTLRVLELITRGDPVYAVEELLQ